MMGLPSCKEMAERASSGEFESASLLTRLLVRFHMMMCAGCVRYGSQMALIGRAAANRPSMSRCASIWAASSFSVRSMVRV